MGKVVLDITMSLDGFIAGPNDGIEQPLGDGGERLHDWIFGGRTDSTLPAGHYPKAATDADVLAEMFRTTGAIVMGRRWFDNGERPWGNNPPFHVPVFVLTHHARETVTRGTTTFTFVTDGIESALQKAQAAAGEKNVTVGSANTAQQFLKAGLLHEIQIHLVPLLLCAGVRLFDHIGTNQIKLESTRVIESPGVAHLRFRVIN